MINNGIPYINGQMYDWAQIKVGIDGVLVSGITNIKYADAQDKVNVWGAGRYPIGYGKGRITCSGSITLTMDEVVALKNASLNARLQDLAPFDITVTYMHPVTTKVVTDVIKDCQFMNDDRDWSEGDTSEEVELELLVSRINWGKTAV